MSRLPLRRTLPALVLLLALGVGWAAPGASARGAAPPAGIFQVGANTTSIEPGDRWQRAGCSESVANFAQVVAGIQAGTTRGFPGKSPNCVYQGGYGLGPSRAATAIDPVRRYEVQTVVIGDGKDIVVWQMVPFVGFFNRYRTDLCDPGCGILDIRGAVAAELDINENNVAIGSNHTHGGADGYGAWGGLPDWYRVQVREALVASAQAALAAARPAQISVGSIDARTFNNQRRGTYQSVADFGAVWLHAEGAQGSAGAGEGIATVLNYSAHPTVLGSSNRRLHGDWPTVAGAAIGDLLGGVGMTFPGGLGNVSPRRPRDAQADYDGSGGPRDGYDHVEQMGRDFAQFVAADVLDGDHVLPEAVVAAAGATITHPLQNSTEASLGAANFLDREFMPGTPGASPGGTYRSGPPERQCVGTGAVSVNTQLSAFRIGDLAVVTAPGEIFSSVSLAVKSQVRERAFEGAQTMVFGNTQDSLGYIIPSYEVYPPGGPTAGVGQAEYEETFLLGPCFGDHVTATMLDLGRQVNDRVGEPQPPPAVAPPAVIDESPIAAVTLPAAGLLAAALALLLVGRGRARRQPTP